MARKSVSFGQLLDYFGAPEKTGPALLHNLQSRQDDAAAIRREFNTNAHLLPPRKNGNVLYHEILSFGDGDEAALTPAILDDLTRRYLDRRAPYALAYAKAHFDTDCPHVHILISANNVGAIERLRLSKQRFGQIKTELEHYQRERYPFLSNSLAQNSRRPGGEFCAFWHTPLGGISHLLWITLIYSRLTYFYAKLLLQNSVSAQKTMF